MKASPWHKRYFKLALLFSLLLLNSCIHYGFTGSSIPKGVNTIFIPFFADQSSGNVPDLNDRLNTALVNRFINRSSLHLADNRNGADALLEGSIISYDNSTFSITGNNNTNQNRVKIAVRATFKFSKNDKNEFQKTFTGSSTYDPSENPISGENTAADEALNQIANNMFNDAVSGW